ncbi:MAG: hypothetical protein M3P24_10120 [Gemmatimonadota bacterium]|nr:hypothetical protein [Gemmatimonadota bacterium]
MRDFRRLIMTLVVALAALVSASPGAAQGKGNGHGKEGKPRAEQVRQARGDGPRLERRARGRSGSYEESHRAFHREQERACRARAAQRPFDVRWQLQVRAECKAEHHRWHERHDS